MGIGDKPYKTLFLLVKAKKQRENMPILLMDEGTTIDDEGEIIEKVERFYKNLCTSEGTSTKVLVAREELLSYVSTCVTDEQR